MKQQETQAPRREPGGPAGEPQGQISVRDGRKLPFLMIEHRFIDRYGSRLSAAEIAIYLVLVRHADQTGKCWPSQERIGLLAGGQRRETVNRHVRRLEELGLIRVESTGNRAVYWLQPIPDSDVNSHSPATEHPFGCDEKSHQTPPQCDNPSRQCDIKSLASVTKSHTNKIYRTRSTEPEGEGEHAAQAPVPAAPPPEKQTADPAAKKLGTFLPEEFAPSVRTEAVALQLVREWFPPDATPELARRWLYGTASAPAGTGTTAGPTPGGEWAEFTAYWSSLPRTARAKKLDWQLTLQNSLRSKAARDRLLMLVLAARRGDGLTKSDARGTAPSPAARFYARSYERAARRGPGHGNGGDA